MSSSPNAPLPVPMPWMVLLAKSEIFNHEVIEKRVGGNAHTDRVTREFEPMNGDRGLRIARRGVDIAGELEAVLPRS